MSEILLQTIVEKLTMQEKDIQVIKEHIVHQQKDIAQTEGISTETIQKEYGQKEVDARLELTLLTLSHRLKMNNELLGKPPKKEIIHHHHLRADLIISSSLLLILILTATIAYNKYLQLEVYKKNDLKYRFLKLKANPDVQKVLNNADSLYRKNKEGFKNEIIQREQEKEYKANLYQEAIAKEREAQKIREKIKRIN